MLRERIDKFDTKLVAYFGNWLEFRSLEFFLSWGKATEMPVLGRLFKKLFDWFCRYYTGFVVPVDGSLNAGTIIMPYENILELVKRSEIARILPCGCRTMRHPTDMSIPRATCMSFSEPVGKVLDEISEKEYKKGEWTTPDKILKTLQECEEYGLVHQIMCLSNPQGRKMYVLCNCDGNKCIPNYLKLRYKVPFVRSSGFICRIDSSEKCKKCGKCISRCIYKATSLENGIPAVNEAECLGCGLCVSTCKAGIRKMYREPKEPFHKITNDYLMTKPKEAMITGKKGENPKHI